MGKTENGKTGKSEIARNLPGSPTTAARRRVTLRDVATAAGVSLKTASNVINGTGRMTDATRAKVEAVIEQTGYRVNVAARNLNRDRTGFITLAVPTLTAPYLSELANRVIDAARSAGTSCTSPHTRKGRRRAPASCCATSTPRCRTA